MCVVIYHFEISSWYVMMRYHVGESRTMESWIVSHGRLPGCCHPCCDYLQRGKSKRESWLGIVVVKCEVACSVRVITTNVIGNRESLRNTTASYCMISPPASLNVQVCFTQCSNCNNIPDIILGKSIACLRTTATIKVTSKKHWSN